MSVMPVKTEQPTPLFNLSATYLIAPDASAKDLASDLMCMLGAAVNVLEQQCVDRDDVGQWAPMYLLLQSVGIANALQALLEFDR